MYEHFIVCVIGEDDGGFLLNSDIFTYFIYVLYDASENSCRYGLIRLDCTNYFVHREINLKKC